MASKPGPLIVIVGETASGKSAAAIELARHINGEVICADSRTVYKGMDIGTAKPNKAEQKQIPHHLLDLVEPDQSFTAADFKRLATNAIKDIIERGKVPIMVGGSGLYIDTVLFDYQFSHSGAKRGSQNPRHLNRVDNSIPNTLRANTIILGIKLDRETLKDRITKRVDDMIKAGLIEETKGLSAKYGWDTVAFQTPGYKAVHKYIAGTISLDETKALFAQSDLQLAKKQRTWFKRNKRIQWLDDLSKIVDIATTKLNKLA